MQSAGHAAAQRKQATHFSRPFSSRCNTCAPRYRSANTGGASGYGSVSDGDIISLNVTLMPLAIALADSRTSPIFAIYLQGIAGPRFRRVWPALARPLPALAFGRAA